MRHALRTVLRPGVPRHDFPQAAQRLGHMSATPQPSPLSSPPSFTSPVSPSSTATTPVATSSSSNVTTSTSNVVQTSSTSVNSSPSTPSAAPSQVGPACAVFTTAHVGSHIFQPTKALPGFYRRTLPQDTCIDFASKEGKKMFAEALAANHLDAFFLLAGQYTHQTEPAYCGITVLVMALNSLSVDPARIWKKPWRWFSEDMMGCCRPLEEVKLNGITLDEFSSLAECKGLHAETSRYQQATLEQFRRDVMRATSGGDQILVVSYARRKLGQTGDGHFAPIAGYHPESDSVLLLDVARFKYPPHWVSLSVLFEAMEPVDKVTQKSRGYVLLKPKPTDPQLIRFELKAMASECRSAATATTPSTSTSK